jgi:hypothetical protein
LCYRFPERRHVDGNRVLNVGGRCDVVSSYSGVIDGEIDGGVPDGVMRDE